MLCTAFLVQMASDSWRGTKEKLNTRVMVHLLFSVGPSRYLRAKTENVSYKL